MKGIELSESFYKEYGEPMLFAEFSDIFDKLAVGVCGSGSECLGYDDKISQDHDYEAGFIIFLPSEDVIGRKTAFLLERAYSKLPKEYRGIKRGVLSPVGGNRRGVIRTADFFTNKVGSEDGNLSLYEWLTIPENYLLESTNGKIFTDNYGEVSRIRQKLKNMPEDIRLKKIAGNLLVMAQSGQYNYMRSVTRGDNVAAQFACIEFVKSAMQTVFLLNRKYMPYYKWAFKAFSELTRLSSMADSLEFLLTSENDGKTSETKYAVIEDIIKMIIEELKNQGLTEATCNDAEKHAYFVNDSIKDGTVRNMNIFMGAVR